MTAQTPATKGHVLHSHARYYDAVARLLTLGRGRTVHARLVELARPAPGERVLDVACGTGSLALIAQARVGTGGAVDGIDASPEMVERAARKARRRGVPVNFRLAAVEALPFPDRSFDVAFGTLMLHHLPRSLRRACVREIARVLRPGGRVLIADFQAPSRRAGGWLARLHRHGAVSAEEIHALLIDAGFGVLESGDIGVGNLHFTVAWSDADAGGARA